MTRSTFLAAALLGLAPAILPAGAAAQSPEGPISYEEQLAQVEDQSSQLQQNLMLLQKRETLPHYLRNLSGSKHERLLTQA